MNESLVRELMEKALLRKVTFPEIIATLTEEGVESYHVDFMRDECRWYAKNGESFVADVAFNHDGVAPQFSPEALDAINRRVQSGSAFFSDFVREGAAAGCAHYVVYINGSKVRYFGRDGGEHIQHFPGSRQGTRTDGHGEGAMSRIARSTIKSVDIQASPDKVFAFLANALNWPEYAVVNLRSVSPGQNGWFRAVTKFGEGELRVSPVKELGILDHIWKDPRASWRVYSRVVPNGGGSTVMMTLFQPAVMDDRQFDHAMKEMDVEMNKLKEILEG